jgi:hypothetical protein
MTKIIYFLNCYIKTAAETDSQNRFQLGQGQAPDGILPGNLNAGEPDSLPLATPPDVLGESTPFNYISMIHL